LSPPSLSGIHHLKVPVSDLDVSLAWYERVLGARRKAESDHHTPDGSRFAVIVRIPGVPHPVELRHEPRAARGMRGFDPVTFTVRTRQDLRAWAEHLTRLGVDHSPELRGIIGWLLVVRDPDGMAIRLYTEEQHEPDEVNCDYASPWLAMPTDP
jgi:catechol 2,3-dioxygenase-like lactoylglutathione lyase family enzyme